MSVKPRSLTIKDGANRLNVSTTVVEDALKCGELKAAIFSTNSGGDWELSIDGMDANMIEARVNPKRFGFTPKSAPCYQTYTYYFGEMHEPVRFKAVHGKYQLWYIDSRTVYLLLSYGSSRCVRSLSCVADDPEVIQFQNERTWVHEELLYKINDPALYDEDPDDPSRQLFKSRFYITRSDLRILTADLDAWAEPLDSNNEVLTDHSNTLSIDDIKDTPLFQPDYEYVSSFLKIANRAAWEFWGTAERDKPKTWPKNTTIDRWLRKQTPCPKESVRQRICTIIRPDWAFGKRS